MIDPGLRSGEWGELAPFGMKPLIFSWTRPGVKGRLLLGVTGRLPPDVDVAGVAGAVLVVLLKPAVVPRSSESTKARMSPYILCVRAYR